MIVDIMVNTSRERVILALNHKQPDKVPLDLGGKQTGIQMTAYLRLLDYLGISDPHPQYYDIIQHLAVPCEKLLERFQIDTRTLYPNSTLYPLDFKLEHVQSYVGIYDSLGVFWGNHDYKKREEIKYLDPVIHPFADFTTVQQIHEYNWPNGKDKKPFEGLRELAEKMHTKTNFAILSLPIGCIYEYSHFLFGFTKAMKLLLKQPEMITAAMNELYKYWCDYASTYLKEVGTNVDVVACNGDLAEQHGPIMRLSQYEKLIKPIEGQFAEFIHSKQKTYINYHTCGAMSEFIPHFADIKYDAVNPVQVGASGMDPASLKAKYGSMILFWGGLCNPQKNLSFGTPAMIEAEVKHNMEVFKPNGGYVGANVHNITAEVPAENIVAMFDSAIKNRDYKK
jgi:uroporphyrinogen decarboxylase